MSNETKKFAGLGTLQAFLDGCKTLFANITHKHTMSDITDSATVLESYESKDDAQAKYDELSSEKKDKDIIVRYADSTRTTTTHTSQEIYAAVNEGTTVQFNNGGTNFHYLEGAPSVVNFYNCFYNNNVMQADVFEIRGNKITNTHFQSNIIKQSDIDTSVNNLKNDLLNGAGAAYDTLKELGDLIDENQDAIEALETVATGKADIEHEHEDYATTVYVDSTFALKSDIKDVDLSNYETKTDASEKLDEAKEYTDKELVKKSDTGHNHDDRYYTETEVDSKLDGKANTSHGNHVPTTQTANNATFLRNDNTWQKVTPANIGAVPTTRTVNGKALSSNITLSASDVSAYSKSEIDNMEFITVADIDAICGTNIQMAREVMF
jgi:hypothetical protein